MKYDAETFLMEVLKIPTVNGKDNEKALAVFLRDFLKDCNVSAVVQDIDSRHANVVGVLEGKSKETVIWNGHLDTVPYGKIGEWKTDPSVPSKKNGCIYARGASDMKSGLAAMAYVLGSMKEKGYVPSRTIYFCGTCDEEKNGMGAKHLLEAQTLGEPALLLIGEPTGLQPGTAQKGCIWLQMKLQGRTSHGAYPEQGINAVEYGIRIFQDLKTKLIEHSHGLLGSPTCQITKAEGGIVPNMTPDAAEFMLDIRVIPGITTQMVSEWLKKIIEGCRQETDGELDVEVHVQNDRQAIEIPADSPWLKKLQWELRLAGLSKEPIGINYFTDASILAKEIPSTPVLLFGPGQPEMAHKPNEYVEIEKYLQYIRILKRFL
ncbi:M20 family metallopeptidase [Extibacter muris]|uniref:M20 family metallopeptidase n=1 Tax=Extibacter muris TaxID=1796622 RepID=UPI001D08D747|nr:M20 family metallopeptidase [Extibacter muris]MCB6202197.1 M20 family metallopeptidase [Extibacter muris]MCQ4662632.1 M20 family metallopeptidase [Extibacter muris]MCQ4693085.1 M20 family metallopeptidase [Extibacter muris]